MRAYRVILIALMLVFLLACCGEPVEPPANVTSTTTETSSVTETTAEENSKAEVPATGTANPNGLLDLALLDRLFSMTYADFCREEGRKVKPEGEGDGSLYCHFSKYGDAEFHFDSTYGLIDGNDLLNAVFTEIPGLFLFDRQALTLGELKNWLSENDLVNWVGTSEDSGPMFYFEWGKYEFRGHLASENDNTPILSFRVYCKSNYAI